MIIVWARSRRESAVGAGVGLGDVSGEISKRGLASIPTFVER